MGTEERNPLIDRRNLKRSYQVKEKEKRALKPKESRKWPTTYKYRYRHGGEDKTFEPRSRLFYMMDILAAAVFIFVVVCVHQLVDRAWGSQMNRRREPSTLSTDDATDLDDSVGLVKDYLMLDPSENGLAEKTSIGHVPLQENLAVKTASAIPNIVIVYIDDQGFNDMGPESTDLASFTPGMKAVWEDGIWLSSYYGQHICTPSRAALLTGKYPIHTGMNHGFISGNDPWGLPLKFKIMPEYLKEAGYKTHMIGKWHLGHFSLPQTPLERGFDTFYGYFSGFEGFFYHTAEISQCDKEDDCYYDLRDGWTPVRATGVYNTYLFDEQMKTLISHHVQDEMDSRPFFLYYALGNVHEPMEAPPEALARVIHTNHIQNDQRRVFAAMTLVADDAIRNLTTILMENRLYDETVLIIASDNGGNPQVSASGSNYPLRGMKGYVWEGGVRVNALIRSTLIPKHLRGSKYDGLFHVTDWLPTIMTFVNREDILTDYVLDGVSQWHALIDRKIEHPRNSMLYNIDFSNNLTSGALRMGHMKILTNMQYQPVWPVPNGNNISLGSHDSWLEMPFVDYLFNITDDPTESKDLKDTHPEIFHAMKRALDQFEDTMIESAYCGAADDAAATNVFNMTQFIGPWINDTDFKCPKQSYADEQMHMQDQYCLYSLLPSQRCTALPGADVKYIKEHAQEKQARDESHT